MKNITLSELENSQPTNNTALLSTQHSPTFYTTQLYFLKDPTLMDNTIGPILLRKGTKSKTSCTVSAIYTNQRHTHPES